MILTGKCKEDFEKWFEPNFEYGYSDFYELAYSMQYGVYVDFFRSVGIVLDIQPITDYNEDVYTEVIEYLINVIPLNVCVDRIYLEAEKTCPEARTAAIEKANEIYNNIKA